MSKAATVYDVADRAGVSIATVSRVLRSPDAVRPVTRERVLDAVAALGYVPSGSARGLAERRTGVLGLSFPGFDAEEDAPPLDALSAADSEAPPFAIVREEAEVDGRHTSMLFLDEVLRGAELEAWKQGFVLMVGVGRDDPDRSTVRDMAGRVDGLMVLASSVPDDVLARLARRIHVVVLSGPPRGDHYDHVTVSNAEAVAELTRHVLAQVGDGRLAFLAAGRRGASRGRHAGRAHLRERSDGSRRARRVPRRGRPGAGRRAGDGSPPPAPSPSSSGTSPAARPVRSRRSARHCDCLSRHDRPPRSPPARSWGYPASPPS